jgi:hypothetical protein
MIEVYDSDFYFLNPLKETLFFNFLETQVSPNGLR